MPVVRDIGQSGPMPPAPPRPLYTRGDDAFAKSLEAAASDADRAGEAASSLVTPPGGSNRRPPRNTGPRATGATDAPPYPDRSGRPHSPATDYTSKAVGPGTKGGPPVPTVSFSAASAPPVANRDSAPSASTRTGARLASIQGLGAHRSPTNPGAASPADLGVDGTSPSALQSGTRSSVPNLASKGDTVAPLPRVTAPKGDAGAIGAGTGSRQQTRIVANASLGAPAGGTERDLATTPALPRDVSPAVTFENLAPSLARPSHLAGRAAWEMAVTPEQIDGHALQIVERASQGPDGAWQTTIRLDPPDLGSIEATITVRAHDLAVVLSYQSDRTHNALQAALHTIRSNIGDRATVTLADGRLADSGTSRRGQDGHQGPAGATAARRTQESGQHDGPVQRVSSNPRRHGQVDVLA